MSRVQGVAHRAASPTVRYAPVYRATRAIPTVRAHAHNRSLRRDLRHALFTAPTRALSAALRLREAARLALPLRAVSVAAVRAVAAQWVAVAVQVPDVDNHF